MDATPKPERLTLKARILLALLRRRCLSPAGMAAYALRNTSYYAGAFADWDGRSFQELPLLTKRQAREASPYAFLSGRLAQKVFLYAETTGSSGSPTPSFFTRSEFHAATLLTYITPYYATLKEVLRANRVCVNGLAFGFTVAGMSFGDLLANIGGLVANTGSRSTLATPGRIARCIARLRPSLVAATPSDLLAWMRIVREDHPDDYEAVVDNLKVLLSTAELCAASRVKRIEEEFDIVHIDVYACVEGFFALPCPCGQKHVLPAYHVEVFDEQRNLRGTHGTGRFAFTNLLKRSTPMVRYLLDDWVTIEPSSCPYGFKSSIVPHGRYELTVPVETGRLGARHVEEEIFRHGLFGDYEVRLTPGSCKLRLERYAGEPEAAPLCDGLRKLLGMEVELEAMDYGALTDYRAVRLSKPILRLADQRPASQQSVPLHL